MAQNPGEIGIIKIFTQFVPSPFGRYENKLELDSTRHDSVRFNGRVCNAVWTTDPEWKVIDIASASQIEYQLYCTHGAGKDILISVQHI